jgi:uncharacterized protein involved in exopolysaccharide biosynthesis
MNPETTYSFDDYVDSFRRRRKILLIIALPIVLGAAALATFLPNKYTAVARIDIDLQGSDVRTLEPIQLTSYADQYIRDLEDRVMMRENLLALVNEAGVFPAGLDELTESERVAQVRDSVDVVVKTQPVRSPGSDRTVDLISGFDVQVVSRDPKYAHRVADYVSKKFLEADRLGRTERAGSTSKFLRDQMSATERDIVALEDEVADFKVANACCLPELMELNLAVIQRTERDIDALQPRIRSLDKERAFKQSQIEEIRQQAGSSGRLAELESEYLRLVANYGPDHPDINRVRREIDAITSAGNFSGDATSELIDLRMRLAEAEQRYSDEHPDVIRYKREIALLESKQGTVGEGEQLRLLGNSRYLQLRADLNDIDTELAELRRRVPELRSKIEDYETRLMRTPQIESEYQALNRKLETARDNFENLQNRLVIASQTEALESTEIGARLTEVRSASEPTSPSGPPRAAIMIIAVFFAGTIGFGAMILAELSDSTVRGRKDVETVLNMVPLAAIPVIIDETGRALRYRQLYWVSGVTLVIVVTVVLLYRNIVL